MKVIYCGTGYVGLTSAAATAHFGHDVIGFDIDTQKVEDINSGDKKRLEHHVNEPGLYDLITEHLGKKLRFTNDIKSEIKDTNVIFLCLPSPYDPNQGVDLSAYNLATQTIIKAIKETEEDRFMVFVNKSTVPVGTASRLSQKIKEAGLTKYAVVSNPEFLAEGKAVDMSLRPDRVVLGARDEKALSVMRLLYSQFQKHPSISYIETTPETAEAIKYVANAFLFTKIVFWQAVAGRLCEKIDSIDFNALRQGVCGDKRINPWGSFVSNGAGGSCFKKDILALTRQMELVGIDTSFIENVNKINEYQKEYLIERAGKELGVNFNNKTVAVLGLAFKKDTNDIREASSLRVIELLLGKGVKSLKLYDALAIEQTKAYFSPTNNRLYENLIYCSTIEEAINGTDGLIICTDWEEFRGLSTIIEKETKLPYFIIDGRRMLYNPDDLIGKGYDYLPVAGTSKKGLRV